MRMIMLCASLLACLAECANAQVTDQPRKEAITDTTIINTCGGRLAKMFTQFGFPSDVWADRGTTEAQDDVFLGYGAYGFKVRDKVIRVCFFFKGWKDPIRGIKIGDSLEEVVKVLGNPRTTIKNKEGVITAYGYDLKDLDAQFFANFKDGKVWRVEVSLK